MRRNSYLIATITGIALLLAGCGGDTGPVVPAPADPPGAAPVPRQEPTGLVGMWAVTGRGVEADTVLRLADDGLMVFRGCEMLFGQWRADQSGLFLADVHGASTTDDGRCGAAGRPRTPDWLARAEGFRADGQAQLLLGVDGTELVRLRPGARPQGGPDVYQPWLEPPTVTEELRRQLAVAPALSAGLVAADRGALVGRWLPVSGADGRKPAPGPGGWPVPPYAEFAADGTWQASDGCNRTGGRWAVGPAGALAVTGGVSTLIGCENVPVGTWLTTARQAALDGEMLVLRDAAGAETGRLRRG